MSRDLAYRCSCHQSWWRWRESRWEIAQRNCVTPARELVVREHSAGVGSAGGDLDERAGFHSVLISPTDGGAVGPQTAGVGATRCRLDEGAGGSGGGDGPGVGTHVTPAGDGAGSGEGTGMVLARADLDVRPGRRCAVGGRAGGAIELAVGVVAVAGEAPPCTRCRRRAYRRR